MFGSEYTTEVGSSVGRSDGKAVSYVVSSVVIGDGKLEGYPLGDKLFGSECRTKVGNYVVS